MRFLCSFLLCLPFLSMAQSTWFTRLHDGHAAFADERVADRRFKHAELIPVLTALPAPFDVQQAGQSVEGRSIYRVSIGEGDTQVLLWSQMHGDEPTATAAILDIFRFLRAENDGFDELRQALLTNLTITFIPMLNPDGAEDYQRRNALGIDLNRDALRLSSPEAQLLKSIRDEISADWGFNLHDQSRFYGAGYPTDEVATLSFLAPAYNFQKSVNPVRERAMQIIAQLNRDLQNHIPGKVARYSDAFEPRAFGDNMQLWGTSTILIESGGYPDDREKQYIRQLNFATILSSMHAMATGSYRTVRRAEYNRIPYNKYGHFNDLILREVTYEYQGQSYLLDIAFDLGEVEYNDAKNFYFRGRIDDIGDLSYQRAYEELPASEYTVAVAKVYPTVVEQLGDIPALDAKEMLQAGVAVVRVKNPGTPANRASLPILVIGEKEDYDQVIQPGANPPLIVRDKTGIVRWTVINGQLHEVPE
ncbi:MAG: M14 family zinc carboxypeptidase [Bacteroidota bacterium]